MATDVILISVLAKEYLLLKLEKSLTEYRALAEGDKEDLEYIGLCVSASKYKCEYIK